ncbi:tetratricopeptide repeat protein [Pedobacter sp. BS3]|uniref:tetratricopeptide repeat protein n=1 Tax=Pedobacter sp. BS3 TaxID=2567937 RepID=UPI0011EBEE09|nr:tetratricopeptide repeat protein [Pedobacter sp. BS3]TZF80922.1 tetratricopeptide repeat protein [Pedobacter sp. BS3]
MKKEVFFLIMMLLSGLAIFAKTNPPEDTISVATQAKYLKPAKVGPLPYFIPPPVDSAQLKRQAVDDWFNKSLAEQSIKNYQDVQWLNNKYTQISLYTEPDDKNIAALSQLQESFRRAGNIRDRAMTLNSIALYYIRRADFEKAISPLQESYLVKEPFHDKTEQAALASALAYICKITGRYEQALAYNDEALQLNFTLKRAIPVGNLYLEIASVRTLQQNYPLAESYILKKALPLFRRMGDKNGKMKSFEYLARLYQQQNRYTEAKWYCIQAGMVADQIGDTQARINTLTSLAQIKSASGDRQLALQDFKTAESMARANQSLLNLVMIKNDVGKIYYQMGDYAAARTAITEYSKLNDTLLNASK